MWQQTFKSVSAVFATIVINTSVEVMAHSISFYNLGNTTVKMDGFAPIVPNGFFIIDDYGDPRIFHDENLVISFDATGVSNPTNLLKIYTQKIKGFPYNNC